jgi:dynein heavy chain
MLLQTVLSLVLFVISVLAQILEEHNKQHNRLNLVLFDDVLEHLTRVHRVLRMHKGHIMIVGEGGSGKHSILRLATYAAGTDHQL